MFRILANVFSIVELRNKILFTLGMLVVYRIGYWVTLPGINTEALTSYFDAAGGTSSAAGKAAAFVAMFAGGSLSQATIFGLGIMPYISASIIFQILAAVSPTLKKIQEEGPTGRQKVMEWTRYATLGLCVFQGVGYLMFISGGGIGGVDAQWVRNPIWWVTAISMLTAGTMFLMWLGEQIDRHGIGNGVSLIITAGIITAMPGAVIWLYENFDPGDANKLDWMSIIMLAGGFVGVIMGAVLMTVAQRRIPVQQAKHTRGRRVFGGQRSYLPLRVNHSGVMPVIFASSLMIFPQIGLQAIADQMRAAGSTGWFSGALTWLANSLTNGQFLFVLLEAVLIFFFSYVWITIQFNPEEMSKQLREHGSFIPGLRPGPRTAEYLEAVMERITFVGAGMLVIIALLPQVIATSMRIDWSVAQFLGGTGLLICVSVCLDLLQRIEANLLMRNYAGFLGGDDASNAPRLRGPRG
jgi:preprotein translocase subunit SecY